MPRRLSVPFLTLLLGTGLASASLAAPPLSEATVKAAFVYNFTKFIEWPAEAFTTAQEPLRLCLFGNRDPFLAALEGIDGKESRNRLVRVQKVNHPAELRNCHVLALGENEKPQMPEALHIAQERAILTVGEFEGFADAGGMIGLVIDNERVQFEVNLDAARLANLKLSSQLLKLARKVRR